MENKERLSKILGIIMFILFGLLTVLFTVLFVHTTNIKYISDYAVLIDVSISVLVSAVIVLGLLFINTNKSFIYKLGYTCFVFLTICLLVLYVLNLTGFWDKIDSIDDLRNYVAGFGSFAVIIFLLMQILQVVVLPIPGFVAIGAGVALFGPFFGGLYSLIGILVGSFIAFFIGRKLGYKVASWVAGKENIDKGLKLIKGKDRVVLTLMFLLPFFPDDILCFVSGLSSMSNRYFIIMIILSRIFSTFTSAYSLNNSLIPFNTWWGILLWIVLFIGTGLIAYYIYKKGDKIEKIIKKRK